MTASGKDHEGAVEVRTVRAPVILLTGRSGAGKTTVCATVIERARGRGLTVGGVLTENVATQAGASAQHITDIDTGERRRLATATREREPVRARLEGQGRPFSPEEFAASWTFDEKGVAFGNAILAATFAKPPDLLIVDQIGPLEFWCGGGFTAVFDVVSRGGQAASLIAVHPLTLDKAKERFPEPLHVLEVAPETRAPLADAVLGLVDAAVRG